MASFEQKISISDIFTNKKEGSIREVKVEIPFRKLTSGEIKLAKSIYKNTLNYEVIKIYFGSFFPLDAQNEDTFVTPNGSIYIMPKHYKDDYSIESVSYRKLFIHELAHVWQHQRKTNVLLNAGALQACSILTALSYDPYIYNIWETATVAQYVKYKSSTKRFLDCNLESQAEIFADYWVLKHYKTASFLMPENRKNVSVGIDKALAIYEKKIKEVIS